MFTPRHMTEEQVRFFYQQPLANLEAVLLQAHMNRLLAPEREPTGEELKEEAEAKSRIEKLEADLKRVLAKKEDVDANPGL